MVCITGSIAKGDEVRNVPSVGLVESGAAGDHPADERVVPVGLSVHQILLGVSRVSTSVNMAHVLTVVNIEV